MSEFGIHRAGLEELDVAFAIVAEYYEVARVVARDSREEFAQLYFDQGAGVWLATGDGGCITGCIALRRLPGFGSSGEIKRLYVQPAQRCKGIAESLLRSLEEYAAVHGYEWLYLDTTPEMAAAERFYRSRGYVSCPRYNENPQATIFLRKSLKPTSASLGNRSA